MIEVSDETFSGLQALAMPFVDTPDAVIAKLLHSSDADSAPALAPKVPSTLGIIEFPASKVPSLKFAVVKSYSVGGKVFDSGVYWSSLIADLLRACATRGIRPEALALAMKTPVCVGEFHAAGYQFVSEAGVSFQQLNSDRSFEQAYLLSKFGGVPFEVTWRWGNDAKASYPGKMGHVSVPQT
jgi:hypothetical protein